MRLFNEHRLPPEPILLTSGTVEVQKFSWRFPLWDGEPIPDTYGGKAVLDCAGSPAFAELAIIPVLEQHGFDGAVWADSYRRCFRNAMPPAVCELPAQVRKVYDRIAATNGSRGGCWDVLAWNRDGVMFVECKRRTEDRMQASQRKWLESALKAGLRLESFAICEWVLIRESYSDSLRGLPPP